MHGITYSHEMDVLTAADNNMRANGREEPVLIKMGHFFSLGG